MNRGYIYLILLILSLFVFDVFSRLSSDVDVNSTPFLLDSADDVVLPKLSEQSYEQLNVLLTSWIKEKQEEKPATNKGISVAEQGQQQGELSTVFAQDKKLKLKAVVHSASVAYALIEVTHVESGMSELTRFNHGAMIEGFSLNISSNTKVELSKEKQQITLIMYQSTKQ